MQSDDLLSGHTYCSGWWAFNNNKKNWLKHWCATCSHCGYFNKWLHVPAPPPPPQLPFSKHRALCTSLFSQVKVLSVNTYQPFVIQEVELRNAATISRLPASWLFEIRYVGTALGFCIWVSGLSCAAFAIYLLAKLHDLVFRVVHIHWVFTSSGCTGTIISTAPSCNLCVLCSVIVPKEVAHYNGPSVFARGTFMPFSLIKKKIQIWEVVFWVALQNHFQLHV